MSEPKTAIAPVRAFEQFQELFEQFCEGVEAQARNDQLAHEQQLDLAAYINGSLEQRDKVGGSVTFLEGQVKQLREKEQQLAARRRNFEKFIAAIKSSLHQALLDMGVRRVEGNEYSFSVKKNPPRVEVVNEAVIPTQFISYTAVIDKAAIKSALEDGNEVPGAELVQSTRLDVR